MHGIKNRDVLLPPISTRLRRYCLKRDVEALKVPLQYFKQLG